MEQSNTVEICEKDDKIVNEALLKKFSSMFTEIEHPNRVLSTKNYTPVITDKNDKNSIDGKKIECDVCKEIKTCSMCSRCKTKNYCSKECQQIDWKLHKYNCNYIASEIMENDMKNNMRSISKYTNKDAKEILVLLATNNKNLQATLLGYIYHLFLTDYHRDLVLCIIGLDKDNNYICDVVYSRQHFDKTSRKNVHIDLCYKKNSKAVCVKQLTFGFDKCEYAYKNIIRGSIDFFKFGVFSTLVVVDKHKYCSILYEGTHHLFLHDECNDS